MIQPRSHQSERLGLYHGTPSDFNNFAKGLIHFYCRTDTDEQVILPKIPPPKAPFYAHKDILTLSKLVASWNTNTTPFPVNPRLPTLPQLPSLPHNYATLLFTSGSSGPPKIACHTLSNYRASAEGCIPHLQLEAGDRWLLSLPLFHVGGIALLFRCAIAGATVVLSELPLIDALLKHQITHLSLVPTQLYRLLQEPPAKLEQIARHMKLLLIGGAPTPLHLLQKARALHLPIHTSYGLTEMSSLVTLDSYPGALPNRDLKLSVDGEVLVRGPTLFHGYLGAPPSSDWFATKDLASWRSDGTLQITGRKDNLFISGGENIQPEEIEALLLTLPRVIEALILPIPDPEFGMRPTAHIRQEGARYTLEEIREYLGTTLPSYKLPVSIHPLPEPPLGLKTSRTCTRPLAQF